MVTRDSVVNLVKSRRNRPMTTEEMVRRLSVDAREEDQFRQLLQQLQLGGQIVRGRGRRWVDPSLAGLVAARLQANPAGFGFAIPVAEGQDVYVPPEAMADAMHNDIVLVEMKRQRRRKGRYGMRKRGPSGRVLRVLHRANEQLVGRFVPGPNIGRVVPDDPHVAQEVYVPHGQETGAAENEIVVVKISAWPQAVTEKNPEGEVIRLLGREGDPGVDVQSVAIQFDLPREFSPRAMREAEAIPFEPPAESTRKRRDLPHHLTVAIDPEDARDRDDALSLHRDERTGRQVVMAHIVDASHYVHPESALDTEARSRGCSVYMVSDFLPMLPKDITVNALGFVQGRDRLAKTVVLEFDGDGELAHYSICPSVVNVDRIMSYPEVLEILEASDGAEEEVVRGLTARHSPEVCTILPALDELARKVRARRRSGGSVDFDVPEYDVRAGEDGRVIAVTQVERDRSHTLIEEFMLSANCAVARFFKHNRLPGIYRTHKEPDEEALAKFAQFVHTATSQEIDPTDRSQLQNLLSGLAGTELADAVNMQLLRAMKRAAYSPRPSAHYALHFDPYCHFTSPLRRYPDLVVHQLLDQYFAGKLASDNMRQMWREKLPGISRSCTHAEQRADEAEREIIKLKMLRYLQERPAVHAQVFDAVITGVQDYGVFAQLRQFPVEGLVSLRALRDDAYRFDERQNALVGARSGRVLRLGTPVRVKIDAIDMSRRTVDFILRPQG